LLRRPLVLLLSSSALLAACGDDEEQATPAATTAAPAATAPEPAATQSSTPAQPAPAGGAAARLKPLAADLDRTVVLYRAGDRQAAEDLAAKVYVERFEELEEEIERKDPELMEEVERAIAVTLRSRIKSGAPVAQVQAVVTSIKSELPAVERALGGAGTTKY